MTLQEVIQSYKDVSKSKQTELNKLKSTIFKVGSLRLAVVLLCAFGIYYFWFDVSAILLCIGVAVVVFLALMKYHNRLFFEKRKCELAVANAENELKAFDYDFSAFDGAAEKADPSHSFSFDLDLFGNRSFFQSVNRTVTIYGKEDLVQKLLSPLGRKEEIEKSQAIVRELSKKKEFIDRFRVAGQVSETEHLEIKNFAERFSDSKKLANSAWRFAPYISLLVILIYIGVSQALALPSSFGALVYVLLLIASMLPLKWMMKKMTIFEKRLKSLKTYSLLFRVMEDEKFEAEELVAMQQQIKGEQSASEAIRQLLKLSNNLSQSQNIVGIFLLNPLMFWNVVYAIKIEKWLDKNKENLDRWFDALAQMDGYISLAMFAYNHPDYTYPQVSEQMVLEAKDLGHPMIRRDVCVTNDVHIGKHPYFLVVTGANMAGKSTYLRTVGLNLMLASVGAPVFASAMRFYPFHLVTNLRTSDSLTDNESYFFAELKRLKMIIDRLESGEELFIILDEILKGTNSEDKQKGSVALMKQLIANKGCGIIATHDLLLGNLEQEYPDEVKNYRFEADITGDELTFTYKIREGVAQNMNACFLMSKMGIVGLE